MKSYLYDDALSAETMGHGFAWMDAGTHDSLLDAGNFVRTLTKRQGIPVGSPDWVALDMGWVGEAKQKNCAQKKNLVERQTTLHLSKPSDNITNGENISNGSAEINLGGLTPSNLISNCLVKEKDQTGLILSPRKITGLRRKSDGVVVFMQEKHKADSS